MQHAEELKGLSLCKAALQRSSAKRHLGKERSALLPVAPAEDTAIEQQWFQRHTSDFRATQIISELHKSLAQRFVYGQLENKFDFKIAQSPVPAQRVTFLFHLCHPFAQQLSQQAWQDFPTRVAGKNLCLGSWRNMFMKGCSALPTALDFIFFFPTPTVQSRPFLSVAAWHTDILVFHENFRRCLQVHSALRQRLTFPLLHLPYPWSTQQRKI